MAPGGRADTNGTDTAENEPSSGERRKAAEATSRFPAGAAASPPTGQSGQSPASCSWYSFALCTRKRAGQRLGDGPLSHRRSSEWRGMAPRSPKDGTNVRRAGVLATPHALYAGIVGPHGCRLPSRNQGRKGIKGRNDCGPPLTRPRPALQVSRAKLGMSWSPISSSPKGSFRTFCLLPGRFTRLRPGRRPCRDTWRLFTVKRRFRLSPHRADCRSARAAAIGPRHESFARCSFLEASRRSPQGDFPESADLCAFEGGIGPLRATAGSP